LPPSRAIEHWLSWRRRVKEWEGEVVFLHEVVPGAAGHSYGIQVAKLAGLPGAVIARAKLVLAKLEAVDRADPRGFEGKGGERGQSVTGLGRLSRPRGVLYLRERADRVTCRGATVSAAALAMPASLPGINRNNFLCAGTSRVRT
jgi:hypothetical protein